MRPVRGLCVRDDEHRDADGIATAPAACLVEQPPPAVTRRDRHAQLGDARRGGLQGSVVGGASDGEDLVGGRGIGRVRVPLAGALRPALPNTALSASGSSTPGGSP